MIQKKHLDTNSFTCIITASIKSFKMQRIPDSGPVFALSGAPGGGKTTIVKLLEDSSQHSKISTSQIYQAYQSQLEIIPEVSRELQTLTDPLTGDLLYDPASRPQEFTKAILAKRILDIQKAKKSQLISILDRSLIDSLGYYDAFRDQSIQPTHDSTRNALIEFCKLYTPDLIFFFPFWPEIYVKDEGRCEKPELAKHISDSMYNAIEELKTPYVVVPQATPEDRYHFVMERIHAVTDSRKPL